MFHKAGDKMVTAPGDRQGARRPKTAECLQTVTVLSVKEELLQQQKCIHQNPC